MSDCCICLSPPSPDRLFLACCSATCCGICIGRWWTPPQTKCPACGFTHRPQMCSESLYVPFKIKFSTSNYSHLTDETRQRVWIENSGDYIAASNDYRLTRIYHVITHQWGFDLSESLRARDRVSLIARACVQDAADDVDDAAEMCQFLFLLNILRKNDLGLLLDNVAATNVLLFAATNEFTTVLARTLDPLKLKTVLLGAIDHGTVNVLRMLFENVNQEDFLDICTTPSLILNEPIATFLKEQPAFMLYDQYRRSYSSQSAEWLSTDPSTYLTKVEAALLKAETTDIFVINSCKNKFNINLCERELLEVHQTRLLTCETSGCVALLKNNRIDDLKRMFRLFSRLGNATFIGSLSAGVQPMATEIEVYIRSRVTELKNNHFNSSTSDRERDQDPSLIYSLHDLYTRCQFTDNSVFQSKIRQAFTGYYADFWGQCFQDRTSTKYTKYLAKSCHLILKKGGEKIAEQDIKQRLEMIVSEQQTVDIV